MPLSYLFFSGVSFGDVIPYVCTNYFQFSTSCTCLNAHFVSLKILRDLQNAKRVVLHCCKKQMNIKV